MKTAQGYPKKIIIYNFLFNTPLKVDMWQTPKASETSKMALKVEYENFNDNWKNKLHCFSHLFREFSSN